MPTHDLYLSMPPRMLFHKDAEVAVYSDGELLGVLKISKGSIEWKPKNHSYGYHLSWEKFDTLMTEQGVKK